MTRLRAVPIGRVCPVDDRDQAHHVHKAARDASAFLGARRRAGIEAAIGPAVEEPILPVLLADAQQSIAHGVLLTMARRAKHDQVVGALGAECAVIGMVDVEFGARAALFAV